MSRWLDSSRFAVGGVLAERGVEEIKNEPMLFNARGDWALEHGGPITQEFLLMLDVPPRSVVFDSRVTMLMAGWWPCIPGWHHDDVPRERADGQPEYGNPSYRSEHAAALVGEPVSQTEFALGQAEFSSVPIGEVVYKRWHAEVDAHLAAGRLVRRIAPMQRIVYFDDRTWHQGARATATGWRWFGRASWNTGRLAKATNELRRQVQVYLEHPMEGW